jgi:hypothetical protein
MRDMVTSPATTNATMTIEGVPNSRKAAIFSTQYGLKLNAKTPKMSIMVSDAKSSPSRCLWTKRINSQEMVMKNSILKIILGAFLVRRAPLLK